MPAVGLVRPIARAQGERMTRIHTRLGKAWDEWRTTRQTCGHLWFIERGGIASLAVDETNPSGGDHCLASPQDIGWLTREQFIARMAPLAQQLPILDKNGN